MRLLFIVDDYLPHSIKVAAKMMHELAVEFIKEGHEVYVLTPGAFQNESLVKKDIDGVKVLLFKCGEYKNVNKIKRAINETLFSHYAWKSTKREFQKIKIDNIVYYSPSIFWGSLVKKLKKHFNCDSYLILRDIFPQWVIDNRMLSAKSPVYWYFKYFEKITYRHAGRIGVMSPANLEFFKSTLKEVNKFEVLYNWASIDASCQNNSDDFDSLGLNNKVVLFYGGNIGKAQHISYLVQLAKRFKECESAHFLFVGEGDEVPLILEEKEKNQLNNITYLKAVDQNTYTSILNKIDIGLFSLHPDHKTHNFPGKLLGYMACQKPILGCVNKGNDLKDIINNNSAGIVVNSGDDEQLFLATKSMIESDTIRKKMGLSGKTLLENQFSVKRASEQILQYFLNAGK